jgi:alkylhydroperoxidase family enzyme
VDAVLADWRTAPVTERVRAALGLIEKMTLAPGGLTSDDLQPPRAAGLSDTAIEDAIHVCALFNIYTRLADSLGFDIPSEEAFSRAADMLLKRGYK